MEPTPTFMLDVDGVPTRAERRPLWWHLAGKTYTASGYGKRIPTQHVVYLEGRWRRVYCCIFSNAGTCYVEGPRDATTGKRAWRIVSGA
jgi:hypothetical protein